jgi:hypothetical protein
MKTFYTVVERGTEKSLSGLYYDRDEVRAQKQDLKNKGLDPIILSSKLDKQQARIIR